MLQHTLNVYQRPAQGTAFLNRYRVYNYKHKVSAMGGFDTMSCDLSLRSNAEGEVFLEQRIGSRVAAFAANPVEPIWEGFINRLSYTFGGVQYTISLDEMVNRASVTYTAAGAGAALATTVANTTASQAVYGIKRGQIEMGINVGGGTTKPNALRDTILAMRAWPQSSVRAASSGGNGVLHIECLGFWYTLDWDVKQDATSATKGFEAYIKTDILSAYANGATFFDNTDYTDIQTNSLTTPQSQYQTSGKSYRELVQNIAETGDGTVLWVTGITPTLYQTGKRRLYYRTANEAIEYTANGRDGLRVRTLYGRLVPPYEVRPDRSIRVNDMLVGWNGTGDDPRVTYIMSVDYDANAQSVTWTGNDDVTARGMLQLQRSNRRIGSASAAQRTTP